MFCSSYHSSFCGWTIIIFFERSSVKWNSEFYSMHLIFDWLPKKWVVFNSVGIFFTCNILTVIICWFSAEHCRLRASAEHVTFACVAYCLTTYLSYHAVLSSIYYCPLFSVSSLFVYFICLKCKVASRSESSIFRPFVSIKLTRQRQNQEPINFVITTIAKLLSNQSKLPFV